LFIFYRLRPGAAALCVRWPDTSAMKASAIFVVASCVIVCAGPGCSSIGTHVPHQEAGVYPGVRADGGLIAHPHVRDDPVVFGHISPGVVVAYSVVDLPFSAALDTLLLPIDLTYRKPKPAQDSSPNPQGGANGRQPFSSEADRTSVAAASRRSP
jgi:uncharacterized protein YceK